MSKKKPIQGLTTTRTGARGGTDRPWRDALRLELARADGPQDKALDRIARIVIHNALNGDLQCIAEIANRLDGRPGVQIDPGETESMTKLIVEWGIPARKVIEHE